jgi:uncharacterized membrane protein
MEIFKFIFYLGIIYTIFGLLWGVVTFLYKTIRQNQSGLETTLLQMAGYYFLASLTAMNVFKPFNVTERDSSSYAFMALGGLVLYFYLMSKLHKKRNILSGINGRFSVPDEKKNNSVQWILIVITLLLYGTTVLYPQIANTQINSWFYARIVAIYDTVILNFIFGIVGTVFLVQILIQGVSASGKIMDIVSGGTKDSNGETSRYSGSNEFDEYEVVGEENDGNGNGSEDSQNQNLLNE